MLGGSRASRLYLDLVETRKLVSRVSAVAVPLASSPAIVQVDATTEPQKLGPAVAGLLSHVKRLADEPPGDEELEVASRALVDGFLPRLETRTSLTLLLAEQSTFGLSDDYFDGYRQELLELSVATVQTTISPYFDADRAVLVAAGSAKQIAPTLTHFGPVDVVDPVKDFRIQRSLAHDPTRGY
jgi:predicted Zn-dependent peptidase